MKKKMAAAKYHKDDQIFCKSIAKSISEIIRYSLNDEFRRKSFELFQVSNTKDTEKEIHKRLMSLVHNEGSFVVSQKTNKNESSQTDKENINEQNESLTNIDTLSTPSTSADSNSDSNSQIFKRNWLQISSQQYREVIKRKKLNYHSQPQLQEKKQYDFESHNFKMDPSNSQPSSNSSLFSSEKISFSQPLGEDLNYCRENFQNSFRSNAQTYLKRNLKSQKLPPGNSQIK